MRLWCASSGMATPGTTLPPAGPGSRSLRHSLDNFRQAAGMAGEYGVWIETLQAIARRSTGRRSAARTPNRFFDPVAR